MPFDCAVLIKTRLELLFSSNLQVCGARLIGVKDQQSPSERILLPLYAILQQWLPVGWHLEVKRNREMEHVIRST
jgi:hypothetical protein